MSASARAAIGETPAARRAGRYAATKVTPTPTTYADTGVAQPTTISAVVQVHAERAHQPDQPDREPDAGGQPERGADQAEQQRLGEHRPADLPPVGAERAQQAELPGALGDQHGEGVDDQEDADQHRDTGEAEHHVLDDVEESAEWSAAVSACSSAVFTS